jgi:hypothetical protein
MSEVNGREPMLHQDETVIPWYVTFYYCRPSEYQPGSYRAYPRHHGKDYGPFATREEAHKEAERLAEFFYPGAWQWNGDAQIVSLDSHGGDIVDFVLYRRD